MYFHSFKEFIEMGGHGFYVWLSYAVVLVALVAYFIYSKQAAKSYQKDLVKFYNRMDTRNQHKADLNQQSAEEN